LQPVTGIPDAGVLDVGADADQHFE
jgi:hypothetical protein